MIDLFLFLLVISINVSFALQVHWLSNLGSEVAGMSSISISEYTARLDHVEYFEKTVWLLRL